MQHKTLIEQFRVRKASLEAVRVQANSLEYIYSLDGEAHRLRVSYGSVNFFSDFPLASKTELHHFAVVLGVLGFARFGAVLPQKLDVSKFVRHVPPVVYAFMDQALPGVWSEHRYQLFQTDFKHPDWELGQETIPQEAVPEPVFPLFAQDSQHKSLLKSQKVLLTSGAGKDSLLCARLLEQANIAYDLVTLFFSLYGQFDQQKQLFGSVIGQNPDIKLHQVYFEDEYYSWLEDRLRQYSIREIFEDKPFRVESGETLLSSLAYVPLQLAHGYAVQAWGNEKSADLPNLVLPDTGEPIAHQWSKSLEAEQLINELLEVLFVGVQRSSLIKPVHDVWIFKTLFAIANDLPYATNSCNLAKPWCGQCEKCAYVFLGFAAYGNFGKTVTAFRQNLLLRQDLQTTWEELMGLQDHISWECVGSSEEAQVYFYKIYNKGIGGFAVQLFEEKVLQPLGMLKEELDAHFAALEQKYLRVYRQHHTMPQWLVDELF